MKASTTLEREDEDTTIPTAVGVSGRSWWVLEKIHGQARLQVEVGARALLANVFVLL